MTSDHQYIPLCGYGHVILYNESTSLAEYQVVMRDHPEMRTINEEPYLESRLTQSKVIND